jgi:hypothetical protein
MSSYDLSDKRVGRYIGSVLESAGRKHPKSEIWCTDAETPVDALEIAITHADFRSLLNMLQQPAPEIILPTLPDAPLAADAAPSRGKRRVRAAAEPRDLS